MITGKHRLEWENLTGMTKMMLPTYTIAFFALGVNFIFGDRARLLSSPVIDYTSKNVLDIRVWGVIYTVLAASLVVSLLRHSIPWLRYSLLFCALTMYAWALIFAVAPFFTTGSYTSWVWSFVFAQACYATNKSVLNGSE